MTPFAVQQVWHAGRRVPVGEKGSTLALVLEAAVQRITAAAMSPTGCPCCRCSIRIRRTADWGPAATTKSSGRCPGSTAAAVPLIPTPRTPRLAASTGRWRCASGFTCRRRRLRSQH